MSDTRIIPPALTFQHTEDRMSERKHTAVDELCERMTTVLRWRHPRPMRVGDLAEIVDAGEGKVRDMVYRPRQERHNRFIDIQGWVTIADEWAPEPGEISPVRPEGSLEKEIESLSGLVERITETLLTVRPRSLSISDLVDATGENDRLVREAVLRPRIPEHDRFMVRRLNRRMRVSLSPLWEDKENE